MAGIITTGNIPKALYPGVREWFGLEYAEQPKHYQNIFESVTSDRAYEEDVQITGFGLVSVKPQGAPVSYDSMQQGFTYRYIPLGYASGFVVTHEEIKDNLYMQIGEQRSRSLAFAFAATKDTIGAGVLTNAFSGGPTYGDGTVLINASHPTLAGNQSNTLGTAQMLSEAAIESLIINIRLALNDRGLRISLLPECLIIPPNLEPEAHRILFSTLQNDTGNNAINYLRASGTFSKGIVVNPYLATNPHYWYIKTNCPNGLTLVEREALTFTQDNDFDTLNAKFKGYERYVFGATDWRGIYGVNAS
jgi:phage major head subunit gpT-like protein